MVQEPDRVWSLLPLRLESLQEGIWRLSLGAPIFRTVSVAASAPRSVSELLGDSVLASHRMFERQQSRLRGCERSTKRALTPDSSGSHKPLRRHPAKRCKILLKESRAKAVAAPGPPPPLRSAHSA